MKTNYMNSKLKIFVMLSFVILFSFSANIVFAAIDPIPGVDIVVKKNPGGIVFNGQTGRDGKFACKLEEGNYELKLSYDQIKGILSGTDKNYASNPDGYIFTLLLGQMPNVKAPSKVLINRGAIPISILVAKGGGTLNGTLTYTKR